MTESELHGAQLIAAERQRQIDVEGWTPEHDAAHGNDALAYAAATYALPERSRDYKELLDGSGMSPRFWPWALRFTPTDRVRELVKAGALIAAEIDRLQPVISPTEDEPHTSPPDRVNAVAWEESSANWQALYRSECDRRELAELALADRDAKLAAVRAVCVRLKDYHGGFDQIRQERKDIADVLDAALQSADRLAEVAPSVVEDVHKRELVGVWPTEDEPKRCICDGGPYMSKGPADWRRFMVNVQCVVHGIRSAPEQDKQR